MDQRWTQIRKLFREALDLEPAQWDSFLASRCPDEEMQQKVLAMLAAYDEEDTFLERPAAAVGPSAQQRDTATGMVGSMVGPYEIRRSIAQGGMGVVFEALDTKLEKVVALKMMSPALVQDPSFRQRFEQEAKTLAKLEDPHFVRVNALIDDGPNTFIVMEYVDGVTLAEHIRNKGPLAGKDAAVVGIQLLQALSKAHRQGIVHRDLKPSNIMLTKNYEGRLLVKVLDFGIAKNLTPDGSQTRTIGAVGTLFYMSPEQARGLRTIDYRTDLYSLGVTLYEAVSGELPFDVGVDEYTVRRQIVEGHTIPLEERLPATEPALARVLGKALATNPDDRYENAEAMGKALVEALEEMRGRQITTERPVGRERSSEFGVRSAEFGERSSEIGVRSEGFGKGRLGKGVRVFAVIGGLAVVVVAGFFIYSQMVSERQVVSENQLESVQTGTPGLAEGVVDTLQDASVNFQEAPEAESVDILAENPIRPDEEPGAGQTAPAIEPPPSSVSSNQEVQSQDSSLPDVEVALAESLATIVDADTMGSDTVGGMTSEETGMLSLRMSQSGSVFVNDVLETRNDLVYVDTLSAGSQLIRVENASYGRWVCAIQMLPNVKQDRTIDFEAAIPVTVVAEDIDSGQPISEQSIYVDGTLTNATTPQKIRLSTGLHKIGLELNNYLHVETRVDEGAGCFQQVGSLVNVDPQSVSSTSPPRLVILMRKIQ